MVGDAAGLGKLVIETLNKRHALPLQAAEKREKFDHIELLNADFHAGRIKIIPGQGPPVNLVHLKAEQAMLNTVRQRLAGLIAQGKSAAEMIAAKPAAEFEGEWGDPTLFIRNAYPGMAHRARELGVSIV